MPAQQPSFVSEYSKHVESYLGTPFLDLQSYDILLFEKEGLKHVSITWTDLSSGAKY